MVWKLLLDILIDTSSNNFHTTVYHKPTDHGHCLNANSECSEKYKNSVISNYLHRAYKVSQNWSDFHTELQHVKQVLTNNNYTNRVVDQQIKFFLDRIHSQLPPKPTTTKIPLYYNSQFHSNYKIEERVIKDIIYSNVKCSDPNDKLNLIFYYRNRKSSNLVMKNNTSPPIPSSQRTDVVYKFTCPFPHREAEDYIGLTSTTLNRRMTTHIQKGSIKQHFLDAHQDKPNINQLLENTSIISQADNRHKLFIKEAILIMQSGPKINKQYNNFTNVLKLYKSRYIPNNATHLPTSSQVDNHSGQDSNNMLPLSPALQLTNHPTSPHITQRINQLLSTTRVNTNTPNNMDTPISRRLRSSQH